MKKNAWVLLLALTMFSSLVTGTLAVYTKSFTFFGSITKHHSQIPPRPSDNEILVYDPGKEKGELDVMIKEDEVSIIRKGDYLQRMTLPAQDYQVEADVSNYKDLHGFGIYIDGGYDEEDNKIYADVIQFVNGDIEIITRSFFRVYDKFGDIVLKEDNESNRHVIASYEDVISILTREELERDLHITIINKMTSNHEGNMRKVSEVSFNGKVVPNQTYPERSILHRNDKFYVGYRSFWGGDPLIFRNVNVTALYDEIPEVIIPEINGADNSSNIIVDDRGVSIKKAGDYLFRVDHITHHNYVVSAKIQVDIEGPGNLTEHLKGFGLYIDGGMISDQVIHMDALYFTNELMNELRLTSYALTPNTVHDKKFYIRSSLEDHNKVTTQGEMGLSWDSAKNGFYLYAAIKGDPFTSTKQVRVFISDLDKNNMKEVLQYYGTPWTGKPPVRPYYKKMNHLYVGFHANNKDDRVLHFSDMVIDNGFDSIPQSLLDNYGW